MSGYVKTFKVKDGDKDDEKVLEKYKTIWTNIESLIESDIRHWTSNCLFEFSNDVYYSCAIVICSVFWAIQCLIVICIYFLC